MTIPEAKENLIALACMCNSKGIYDDESAEAVKVAIKSLEAWEKVIDDINNYNISPDKPKDYVRGNLDCQILILDIIDKHLKSKEGDTDG